MKRYLMIGMILLMAIPTMAQDSNSGIVYGENWAFMFSAPEGFKWDNNALQKQGIWALFYKNNQEKYQGNVLNMYINPVMKGGQYPSDIDSLIEWDTEYFKNNNPGLEIGYYKDLILGDKNIAKVYAYNDDARKYYMLYGYTVEANSSFIFVLIARSMDERKMYEKSYEELLKSFRYIDKQ